MFRYGEHRGQRMTRIGAITDATLRFGTPALRSAFADLARRATTSMHVDLFRVGDDAAAATFGSLAKRNLPFTVLADTDATTGKAARLLREQVGDGWQELGTDPLKQHGKSASINGGTEAMVASDIADPDAAHRIELALEFGGAPARALGRIHAAAGEEELARALEAGAKLGIVANDPRVGAFYATEAIQQLIAAPGARLRVMTKAFDDEDMARQIAAAVRQASDGVELLTHEIPKAQRKLLERAGVTVRIIDADEAAKAGVELHGTLIVTEDRAFIGSAYLESRVLHGSGGRQSREVGAVVAPGDAHAQASAAYDELVAAMP